jgi:hypothetical protein
MAFCSNRMKHLHIFKMWWASYTASFQKIEQAWAGVLNLYETAAP